MIEENDDAKFQFSADDEEPEAIIQDELRELKMEKLGQRVTLLTILIPCMIGVILVIAYLDIKDRVTRSYDTGAIGVQKLSKDLSSKFSSLSLEQAKIKDIQSQKIPELEKSAAFIQSRLTALQDTMAQITAGAVNRDELTRVVDSLNKKVGEIPQGLKPDFKALALTDDQIVADARRMSDELKTLSAGMARIHTRLDELRKETAILREKAINKDELELALKLKEIGYRQSLLEKTSLLEKEIQALKKEIKDLQKKNNSTSGVTPTTQPSPAVPQKPADDKTGDTFQSKPATVESGGIVEQTIE